MMYLNRNPVIPYFPQKASSSLFFRSARDLHVVHVRHVLHNTVLPCSAVRWFIYSSFVRRKQREKKRIGVKPCTRLLPLKGPDTSFCDMTIFSSINNAFRSTRVRMSIIAEHDKTSAFFDAVTSVLIRAIRQREMRLLLIAINVFPFAVAIILIEICKGYLIVL